MLGVKDVEDHFNFWIIFNTNWWLNDYLLLEVQRDRCSRLALLSECIIFIKIANWRIIYIGKVPSNVFLYVGRILCCPSIRRYKNWTVLFYNLQCIRFHPKSCFFLLWESLGCTNFSGFLKNNNCICVISFSIIYKIANPQSTKTNPIYK